MPWEDYTIPLVNAIVLETTDPQEVEGYVLYLRDHPDESHRIRQAARRTARMYTWEAAVRNLIGKLEHQARLQGILGEAPRRLGHRVPSTRHHDLSEVDQGSPLTAGKAFDRAGSSPKGQSWQMSERSLHDFREVARPGVQKRGDVVMSADASVNGAALAGVP